MGENRIGIDGGEMGVEKFRVEEEGKQDRASNNG
jgi:hypothetical protein